MALAKELEERVPQARDSVEETSQVLEEATIHTPGEPQVAVGLADKEPTAVLTQAVVSVALVLPLQSRGLLWPVQVVAVVREVLTVAVLDKQAEETAHVLESHSLAVTLKLPLEPLILVAVAAVVVVTTTTV